MKTFAITLSLLNLLAFGMFAEAQNVDYLGNYNAQGTIFGVCVSCDYAYATVSYSGLQIIDVADPFNPSVAGSYEELDYANDVFIDGNYAFVTDSNSGLHIIDVSDPLNPIFVGENDTLFSSRSVFVSGNYAYVANLYTGLRIIDISDLSNPISIGSYYENDNVHAVFVFGSYALISISSYDGARGFQIIDISDPANPVLVGNYDTPAYLASDFFVSDAYAYVATNYYGLQIFDISVPSNPTPFGSFSAPDNALSVFVSGNYAYVADRYSGLQVIDISNPSNPTFAGSYDTPGYARDVFVEDRYVYLADGGSLIILRFNTQTGVKAGDNYPKELSFNQNYPNPFNESTIIEYSLTTLSDVTIEIFDILGNRVETLFSGRQTAGKHRAVWNAENFSTGAYFYRVQSGEIAESQKMILIK
jgi:hypothetical protein